MSDVVNSQMRLLDHLGLEKLLGTVGGSIGGMLSLDLAVRYLIDPGRIFSAAAVKRHTATEDVADRANIPGRQTAGTELHIIGSLGVGWQFGRHWSSTLTARAEHHFIDLRITDLVSGASGTIDSLSPLGFYLSADYRF